MAEDTKAQTADTAADGKPAAPVSRSIGKLVALFIVITILSVSGVLGYVKYFSAAPVTKQEAGAIEMGAVFVLPQIQTPVRTGPTKSVKMYVTLEAVVEYDRMKPQISGMLSERTVRINHKIRAKILELNFNEIEEGRLQEILAAEIKKIVIAEVGGEGIRNIWIKTLEY